MRDNANDAEKISLYSVARKLQAIWGRSGKQQQEQTLPNHVQRNFFSSVIWNARNTVARCNQKTKPGNAKKDTKTTMKNYPFCHSTERSHPQAPSTLNIPCLKYKGLWRSFRWINATFGDRRDFAFLHAAPLTPSRHPEFVTGCGVSPPPWKIHFRASPYCALTNAENGLCDGTRRDSRERRKEGSEVNRTAGLKRTESPCILTGDRENFPTYGKSLGSGDKPVKVPNKTVPCI